MSLTSLLLTGHDAADGLGYPRYARDSEIFEDIRRRKRNMRCRDPHRRPVQIVKGFISNDRNDLGAPAQEAGIFLDREDAMRPRNRPEYRLGIQRIERAYVHDLTADQKSVVKGKSVAVRVEHGGRGIFKKKKKKK